MNNPKLHETKKLHYGKYLYKLSVENQLSSIFRREHQRNGKLLYAKSKLDDYTSSMKKKGSVTVERYRSKSQVSADELSDAISLYNALKNCDEYLIRCEYKKVIIYTNDTDLISKLNSKIIGRMEVWKPDSTSIKLLEGQSNVIVSNKPTDFPYKISFGRKPGKPELAAWIEKNVDKVRAGAGIMRNLKDGSKWIQGQYIFARDENIIMLIQMIVGDNISRIDKIICKADVDK
jgi:hypothetical protein